ncbi:MAG: protein O-mannosyl-transferase family, partial [Candidatus Kapaibacterium sp.]
MITPYLRSTRFAGGFFVFICACVTYGLCVQPTVPFWDCGEFTAAIVHQQVPHPPGAPLFLMVGKLAHLVPFGDPALRVNLLSALFSAVTVWLVYEIIIMGAIVMGSHARASIGSASVERDKEG